MNIVHKILPQMSVLVVTFRDAESYGLRLVKCRMWKNGIMAEDSVDVSDLDCIKKELTGVPVLVLIGGYGVITKQGDTSGDIVAKITAMDSGFRWTWSGNDISFVREEQLTKLKNAFEGVKAKVVDMQCIPLGREATEEDTKQTAAEYAGRYYMGSVKFGTLLKPSIAGSALAQLTASRLKLPVLGLVLLALMINVMVNTNVRTRYETANMELQVLEKTIGQADDATQRQRAFFAEYNRTLPKRISWLCDRAAMVLPEKITLTSLAVQPPSRSLENNKKTMFAENTIEITGESPVSADVSEYITRLGGLGFASQVRLASMEQDRESGLFNFRIIIEL